MSYSNSNPSLYVFLVELELHKIFSAIMKILSNGIKFSKLLQFFDSANVISGYQNLNTKLNADMMNSTQRRRLPGILYDTSYFKYFSKMLLQMAIYNKETYQKWIGQEQ